MESSRQAGAELRLRVNVENTNKQAELKLDCDLETEQKILVKTAELLVWL